MTNPLDLVTFDAHGFEPLGDQDAVRRWYSPRRDGVVLYYFPISPDIEADPNDVRAIRAYYRQLATDAGHAIIEVDTHEVHQLRVIQTVIKVPEQPTGTTYLGSITIPRRDFSFVLKVQCREEGVTGMRDALVLDELLSQGELSAAGGIPEGWMQDPYDPSFWAPLMRNRAEAEKYDSQFPDHPLSRARSLLVYLRESLEIAPVVHTAAPFEYPRREALGKPWWKRW